MAAIAEPYEEGNELTEAEARELTLRSREDLHYAMRRLAEAEGELEEIADAARRDHSRITQWENRASADALYRKTLWEGQITAYMAHVRRETDGRVKSYSTPWGYVESRKLEPECQRDPERLFAWARAHERFIRRREEVDWAALKRAAQVVDGQLVVDGEPVDGVTVVERDPSITITPDTGVRAWEPPDAGE